MKKHIVALIAVLALLVSALPLQAFAAGTFPGITVNEGASTSVIEKNGAGRLSLTIEPARRSEERCEVVFVNDDGRTVGEQTITLENTTASNRFVTVTIDAAGMGLSVGEYTARCWIESKNQSTSRWEVSPDYEDFDFEVVNSRCGTSHSLKKISEEKATCCKVGTIKYECTVCGHVSLEETPMTDHAYELDLTKPYDKPTASSAGEGTYVCQTCKMAGITTTKIDAIPVSARVKITSHPQNLSIVGGKTARFTVVATGMELTHQGIKMTYQWEMKPKGGSWADILGADKAYYQTVCSPTVHESEFRCKVIDIFGNVETSHAATLIMSDLLSITKQPEDAWAYDGQKATVSVKATGLGLKYAWYVKDTTDSDFWKSTITSSTYSVTMSSARDGRQVYCLITDGNGSTIKSDTVTLTTCYPAKIIQQPVDVEALENDTVVFSVVATSDRPLTYRWYYRNKGTTTWKESECTDAVYATTLTAERDGREVYCKITDGYGNTISSNVAKMKIVEVAIIQQPKSVAAYAGDMATFSVEAIGVELEYQWYYRNAGTSTWKKGGINDPSYTTEMTTARDGRQIRCVITDKYGHKVTTDTVSMSLKVTLGISSMSVKNKAYSGEKVQLSVKATGEGLSYAWYFQNPGESGWTKSTIKSSTYSLTMNAANDGRKVYCAVTDTYGNVVESPVVTLDTLFKPVIVLQPANQTGSAGSTVTFSVTATGEGTLKYQWYYRNAGTSTWKVATSTSDTYTTDLTAARNGRQVRCVVADEYGNTVTSNSATMMLTPVKITDQPDSVTASAGSTVTFSVTATGEGTLKYQWYYKNAGSSSWKAGGSTTNTYTTEMTASRDGRQVRCVVTDENGSSVISDAATMKLPALKITQQPKNKKAAAGTTVTFSITAAGDGPLTYQWYYKNKNGDSWKKGASTSDTYTVDVTEERDGRRFYCKVTDVNGKSVSSDKVTLTVD